MKIKLIFIILGMLAICGCKPNDYMRGAMNRMVSGDDETLAKECVLAICSGDYETAKDQFDPQIVKSGVETNLAQIAAVLDHGEPLNIELVGCNVVSGPERKRSQLSYQYHFTNAWVMVNVTIDAVGESKKVMGVNVNPLPKSLGEINAFTLSGKSVGHYVLLFLAVTLPVFMLSTMVLCIRTKMQKKWLWVIFILTGIMKINLNWTTGQIGFQPIVFQLFGCSIVKMGLYAPWILSVSFPLGAIMFLSKRRKILAGNNQKCVQPPPLV